MNFNNFLLPYPLSSPSLFHCKLVFLNKSPPTFMYGAHTPLGFNRVVCMGMSERSFIVDKQLTGVYTTEESETPPSQKTIYWQEHSQG